MVRAQHAPVAQPDRQVHGRAEPDAVPAEVPAAGVQERAVLVQEPPGQVQAAEDVPVRRHVAQGPVRHAHVPQPRLTAAAGRPSHSPVPRTRTTLPSRLPEPADRCVNDNL